MQYPTYPQDLLSKQTEPSRLLHARERHNLNQLVTLKLNE